MMEDVLMEIVKDRVDEKVNAKEQQTTVTRIRDIMESFGVTIEKAMDSLKIPQSQLSTYAGLVGKKKRCDDEHREILCFTYVQRRLTGMFRNATLRQHNCAAFQFHKYFTSKARGRHALLSGFFVFVR